MQIPQAASAVRLNRHCTRVSGSRSMRAATSPATNCTPSVSATAAVEPMSRSPTFPADVASLIRSHSNPGQHQLVVILGRSQQQPVGCRPLEEQVRVVFPGEADAAVHLDALAGGVEVDV